MYEYVIRWADDEEPQWYSFDSDTGLGAIEGARLIAKEQRRPIDDLFVEVGDAHEALADTRDPATRDAECWCGRPSGFVNPATDATPESAVCWEHVAEGYRQINPPEGP